MTKMCLVVDDLGGMAKRGLPWSRSVGAVPGFLAHRSTGYQRISARRGGDGRFTAHAPRTRRPRSMQHHETPHPGGSLVRRSRVAASGTHIIYVRRILLGHSLPSPAGRTAPPPPVSSGTT
ncbi:hypothetical protein GCM10019016_041420 [Streptomyces prasinosporus]|uniref:Uncharacterized protein n=1 Tax=Streptomyces prasinosporus TaxID=68256 RepID=A0ABP6TRJ9_9ACTN